MRKKAAGLLVFALLALGFVFLINSDQSARADGFDDQLALFDPYSGEWVIRSADGTVTSFYYGNPGDTPLLGDWDCDGVATVGMFRPSNGFVYLRDSNTFGVADREFFYGLGGDIPLVGDWNGDGCDTLAIYRSGEVFVANRLGTVAAEFSFFFGNPGDRPFAGDFDGDGASSVGLYRESTGFAYFRNSLTSGIAELSFFYGEPSDRILAGDWEGDGDDSVGIFRPDDGNFYLSYENRQGLADMQLSLAAGDLQPLAGRVDAIPVPTTTTTTTTTTLPPTTTSTSTTTTTTSTTTTSTTTTSTTTTSTTTTTLPPIDPVKIMALGDSITEGYNTAFPYDGNTYRFYLWNSLVGDGYDVDFVGWRTATGNGSYGNPSFDQDHQARSGADAEDLEQESSDAIAALAPDVAVVQIGVNDIWGPPSPPGDPNNPKPYDPASAMANITGVISNLRAANPDVAILVGELIPCDVGAVCVRVAEMNSSLASLVAAQNTAQSPVVLVPINGDLGLGDLADGLHPNDSGDQKIAAGFFTAITPFL